jgi:hypothetical protein
MTKKLTFLHTAATNVATFDQLLRELAPDIPAAHLLDERLLADARAAGTITPALAAQIEARLLEADAESAVVLCTCSTIGGAAEAVTHPTAGPVVRVDRAMAEQAVALGETILVAAALASTLAPTRELILDAARQAGKPVTITELLCEGAWARFEAGDQAGYWQAVADCLHEQAGAADVIVLAQASMAGAAALCGDLPIPILSSPRLGLEAAIRLYRARVGKAA